MSLLKQVPGISHNVSQVLIAEIGTDMSRYPTHKHLCSWAGVCPGNNQSAGKRRSGRVRPGNVWLKAALCQAAWGASRTRRSYFSAQHRRLMTRRGAKRANIAVAHSLLTTCYYLLKERKPFADLGSEYFQKTPDPDRSAQHLVKRLKKLGYNVTLERPAA
jgi:transposase